MKSITFINMIESRFLKNWIRKRLYLFVLSRFRDANRCSVRWKTI